VSSPTLYVLDANVFIQAAKGYYAFDLAPKFWQQLVAYGAAGSLCTVDRIAAEINYPAELRTWVDSEFRPYVRDTDSTDTLAHYATLMQWAQGQTFTPAARQEFATVPDAWLIAYAKGVGGTVVTHETFDANRRNRVKIPNARQFLGVLVVDTYGMLRSLAQILIQRFDVLRQQCAKHVC